jgi:hypothetical protein
MIEEFLFNKVVYSETLRAVVTWPTVTVDPWINKVKTYVYK